MRVNRNNRFGYVIFALICVVIFFTGFHLMSSNNMSDSNKVNADNFDKNNFIKIIDEKIASNEVVKDELKKYGAYINSGENNIYKKILSISNTFMYLKEKDEENNIGISNIVYEYFKKLFKPRRFIEVQLNNYISLVDNTDLDREVANNSNDESDENTDEETDVQPIDRNGESSVKPPTDESKEFEDENKDSANDIVFVDPYEDEDLNITPNIDISSNDLMRLSKNIKSINVNNNKPYVLIYHTHASESYLPKKNNNFHIEDKDYNVLKVGDIITNTLTNLGHNVRHIEKYHDLPYYNSAYPNSANTIRNETSKEKNLKILLDIHRDGIGDEYKKALEEKGFKSKINIDGKDVATFSIVIGPDNPNYKEIFEFAKYINKVADVMYPGLCTGITKKSRGKYNLYYSDYSALIEVGSNLNTIEEAEETAVLIGNILSKALDGIKQ